MVHLVLAVLVCAQADGSKIEQAFQRGGANEVVAVAKSIEKQDGVATAVRELSQAVAGGDIHLRATVAHVLGSMGDPAKLSVPALAAALGDADDAQKIADELNDLGSGDIPIWLAEALLRNEKPLSDHSYHALSYHLKPQDPRIVPILITGINHPDTTVRWHSVVILGEMKSLAAPAHPHLVRLLKSTPKPEPPEGGFSDNDVRARATIALGSIAAEPTETMALLISLINDPDAKVRENAVLGLGWMKNKAHDAIPTLIALIEDERLVLEQSICIHSAHPRHAATTALVNIGDAAVQPLVQALESKNVAVRRRAAEAFTYVGLESQSVAKALLRRLRDVNEDADVRKQALYAISLMGWDPKRFEQELIPLTSDKDPAVRAAAAMRLGYVDREINLDPLVGLIGDVDPEVRKAALDALVRAAPPEVLRSAVDRLLKDTDESVRERSQELKD
jgi:HEAT repeat protein